LVSDATGHVHDLTAEREGDTPPAAVDTQIEDPRGIALDDRGRIYVANGGERQNVTVYDADGSLVNEIGSNGGRPRIGRFEPDGMLEPGGITIDADGRLWVTETLDSPKRHSVWDTRSGELVDQFFGGTAYAGPVWMDPEHPDEVYCHDVLWKVDLDTGEKRPHSTIHRKTEENAPPSGHGFQNPMRVFTANNGRQYAWGGSNRMTTLFERDGDVFRPLMGWLGLNEERAKRFGLDETGQYVWRDTNGDGLMQADEFEPLPEPAANRSSVVGPDLSLYTGGKRYRPTEITDGVPAYDYESPEELTFGGLGGGGLYPIHPTGDAHYTWFADRTLDEPDETPGFAKRTLDGDLQWGFTRTAAWKASLEAGAPKPGEFHAVTHLLGEAGGFTGTQHYMGNSNIVTTDGIAVGDIYRTDSERGFDRRFTEAFFGQLVQPTGMDRYFHLGGDADGRIVEVHGLDTVQRLDGGTYTVTEEDAALAQRAYEQYRQNLNASQSLTIVRGDRGLESASGVSVSVDENRSFTAKLAYADRNLYVQYRVESPAPLTNAVSDPKFLFEGGNCIDIQLATGDADPDREEPAPGDVRLLITRRDGSPFAMLYEPDVEGFSGDPVVFESPVDEESFDRISQVDGVELAYETTADGFTATATVPLSAIGFSPEPASTVRGDVGYVFGDTEGRGASARAYWANNGFEANVVDDVPDESRLNPEHWGSIVVE
jgi:hypothetical protein